MSRLRTRAVGNLVWLERKGSRSGLAAPCLLPGCPGLVNRSSVGRQGWFHTQECGKKFRRRKAALKLELNRLEALLADPTHTVDIRRQVESDTNWVRTILSAFADGIGD